MIVEQDAFWSGDGDDYFYKCLKPLGFALLYRLRHYHWFAICAKSKAIVNFC